MMLIVDTVQDRVAHIVHRNRLSENDLANIKETSSNPQGAFRSVVGGMNSPRRHSPFSPPSPPALDVRFCDGDRPLRSSSNVSGGSRLCENALKRGASRL